MADDRNDLFPKSLATNGLANSYGSRRPRCKHKGLRFAVVVLLLALVGAVYVYQTDQIPQLPVHIDQLTKPDEDVGKYGPRSQYIIDEDE